MCLGWIESSSLCYIVGLLYMCLGTLLQCRFTVHVPGLDRK